jgi:hypothetical protein
VHLQFATFPSNYKAVFSLIDTNLAETVLLQSATHPKQSDGL